MHHYQFSPLGKAATSLAVGVAALSAIKNIASGEVPHPHAFAVVLFGFALFSTAKFSLGGVHNWLRIGPTGMTPDMVNLYRSGYWFMALGVLLTFS